MSQPAAPEPQTTTEPNAEGVRPIVAARPPGSRPDLHPGRGLGIASIFFAILPWAGPISGLAAGIAALRIARKVHQANPWAVTGIWLSAISAVVHIAFWLGMLHTVLVTAH